ncbi:MAG TPA: Rrf2 family transcriptional regulator, partial [Acidimicrobiales bacterium]|nr:Rrf2 family transcriptional regulator [Acidimicrobiales bacterium]
MYISAKVDYATRALAALAASPDGAPMTGDAVAEAQRLPVRYVENLLVELRRSGFVTSQRGNAGGYRLARPAGEISVADVMRAVDGPLAEVRGLRPDQMTYEGAAEHLQHVWVAVRAGLRQVLDSVTIAHI